MAEKYLEYAGMRAYELLEELGILSKLQSTVDSTEGKELSAGVLSFDLDETCKELGIKLKQEFDFNRIYDGEEGRAYVEGKKPVIWISNFLGDNRKRFTLAHEIAHVITDIAPVLKKNRNAHEFKDDVETLNFARNGNQNIVEYYANDFAAMLLMHKDIILECAKKITKDSPMRKTDFIKKMAKIFSVSESAMCIRLIRLGIIDK